MKILFPKRSPYIIDTHRCKMLRPWVIAVANEFHSGSWRNEQCLCGSGKKFKDCHGIDRYLSLRDHANLTRLLKGQQLAIRQELASRPECVR